jgi:hypothetical protein
MWWYDPDAASREVECNYLRQFRHMATEDILAHLTDTTTPEQYQVALDALLVLKDELTGQIDAFHRSPLYGRHRCLENEYFSLRLQIQNAMVLKPVPQPEPAPDPTPEPPRKSLQDVLEDFENEEETYLGDIVPGDEE